MAEFTDLSQPLANIKDGLIENNPTFNLGNYQSRHSGETIDDNISYLEEKKPTIDRAIAWVNATGNVGREKLSADVLSALSTNQTKFVDINYSELDKLNDPLYVRNTYGTFSLCGRFYQRDVAATSPHCMGFYISILNNPSSSKTICRQIIIHYATITNGVMTGGYYTENGNYNIHKRIWSTRQTQWGLWEDYIKKPVIDISQLVATGTSNISIQQMREADLVATSEGITLHPVVRDAIPVDASDHTEVYIMSEAFQVMNGSMFRISIIAGARTSDTGGTELTTEVKQFIEEINS